MDDEAPLEERIEAIRQAMYTAAEALDFEKAAELRDEIKRLEGRDAPKRKRRKPQRPRR